MDIETLKDFATRQRAIRLIDTSREVDDALIEQILEVGTHAPSGGNRQIYRFIVIRDCWRAGIHVGSAEGEAAKA